MMKKICLLLIVSMTAVSIVHSQEPSRARDGLGIGIMIGEPTGLSFKQWVSRDTAIAGGAAWSFSGRESFHIHADHVWHLFELLPPEEAPDIHGFFSPYFGIGMRARLRSGSSRTGVRIPGGVSYIPPEAPLEIFLEIAPIMDVVPDTTLRLNAALGARYFF